MAETGLGLSQPAYNTDLLTHNGNLKPRDSPLLLKCFTFEKRSKANQTVLMRSTPAKQDPIILTLTYRLGQI